MRYVLALVIAAGIAGCTSESIHPPNEWREEAGPEGTDVNIDPAKLNNPTSELGTDRVRPIAKTIEWPGISTEVSETYRGDAVVVDHIFRDDSDNSYGIRVRVKNTTPQLQKLEYLIRFYNRDGARLAGWAGGIGATERWQGFVLEPLRHEVLTDSCKVIGAEGFRLAIRSKGAGAGDQGVPDDPAKKEERRQQREAGTKQ